MKNLKIRTKLIMLVAFLLVGIISVGIVSMLFMTTINDSTTEIAKNYMPSAVLAEQINTLVSDTRVREYKHIVSTDQQEMNRVNQELEDCITTFDRLYSEYYDMISSDNEKVLVERIRAEWDAYISEGDSMIALSAENNTAAAMAAMSGEHLDSFNTLTASCLELSDFNQVQGDKANTAADVAYAVAQTATITCLVAIIILAVGFSIYIVISISRPIKELDNIARKIAGGDLNESIHYKSRDELGVLAGNFNKTVARLRNYVDYIDEISAILNEIADGNLVFETTHDYAGEFAKVKIALDNISESLNHTMTQIDQASDQVSSGSQQVSSGAMALSQGASEQASSVEELSVTIGEISHQVNDNAENANTANEKMRIAGLDINNSNEKMKELIKAMSHIDETSHEIGKVIKTIDDIAFQTNILALNAAVEAARAGAAGKGFAVVADEVRSLAGKSAEAAKGTTALIEGSVAAVAAGTRLVDDTAEALSKVVVTASEVSEIILKISEASNSQATAISQVTQGVDQISSVVQTNSATAEESAASSEELSAQASALKELVGRFKLKQQ